MFFAIGAVPLENFEQGDDVNLFGKEFFPREQYTVLFDRLGTSEVTLEAKTRFFVLIKKARYISVKADYKTYNTEQPLYPDHDPIDYRLDYSDEYLTILGNEEWEGDVIKAQLEFRLSETTYRLINCKTDREYFELTFKTTGTTQHLGETEITFYL